jgi:hypothetical protein
VVDDPFKNLVWYPAVIVAATLADIVITAWLPLLILVALAGAIWWIARREA